MNTTGPGLIRKRRSASGTEFQAAARKTSLMRHETTKLGVVHKILLTSFAFKRSPSLMENGF
jgi:hypothetical protein